MKYYVRYNNRMVTFKNNDENKFVIKEIIASNTLLVEIEDSDAARAYVESRYSTGTFSYEKINDTKYKITNTATDWSSMFLIDTKKDGIAAAFYLHKVLDAGVTSTVTNMSYMFSGCKSLTSVPKFDTSNVTDMSSMFKGCSSLTSVPKFDTSNVTDMSSMFGYCSALTEVPVFDTSNVTDMSYMFYDCSALTEVPVFDTSNVTDMSYMFYECTALTSVPLFNTSSVTNMQRMFYECTALTIVPLFNISSVTNMQRMFYNCFAVESGALALYQAASTKDPVPDHAYMFVYCGKDTETGITELQQIPFDWGGLKVD